MVRLHRLTAAASGGDGWQAAVHPDDLPRVRERSAHSARTGGVYEVEYRLRRHDGAYRWHLARAVRVAAAGRWFGTATDVDDLKRAEAALRDRDEQLAVAQRAAGLGVSSLDLGTGVGVTTPEWRAVVGMPDPPARQDFPTFLAGVHPDDRGRVAALHAGPPADGLEFEFRVVDPGGGVRWVLSRSKRVRADGGPGRLVGVAIDVTARKAAEAAARAADDRFRAVAANLPSAAAFVVGPDLRYQLAAGQALAAAGLAPAHFEGRELAATVPPDQAAFAAPYYRRALGGEPFRVEHTSFGRDFVTHGVPLRGGDGRVYAALAVSYDITDRRRAEAALRASEERFRLLADNVTDHAIYFLDPGGRVDGWDGGAERLLGYRAAEVVGHPHDRFYTAADRAAGLPRRELGAAAGGRPASDENWLVRKDGSRFWASGTTTALRDPGGGLRGFVKIFRDLSDRRAAEAAVQDSRERLRQALAAAQMGTWAWFLGADEHVRDASLNRLLGRPAVDTRGPLADFLACVHPDDRAAVAAAFDASVRAGRPLAIEFRVARPDGTVRWLRDQGDVFGGPDPAARRLTGACVDITDLKRAEDGLRRARDELDARVTQRTAELAQAVDALQEEMADRQAAEDARRDLLGRLVTAQEEERRRVARDLHDALGQYLAAMRLGLRAARAAPDPAAFDRLEGLTDDIGKEAHRLAIELRPTALDDLGLAAAVRHYVEAWAARTGVAADFEAPGLGDERFPWQVSTAVYRVVQEALTNVVKHAAATRVGVLLDRRAGDLVVVVEDDGRGFDPAAAPTAPTAGGGLGLLGMRERVGLVGGDIQIESAAGAGATVFVRVPVPAGGPADE